MAIFNSYVTNYQRVSPLKPPFMVGISQSAKTSLGLVDHPSPSMESSQSPSRKCHSQKSEKPWIWVLETHGNSCRNLPEVHPLMVDENSKKPLIAGEIPINPFHKPVIFRVNPSIDSWHQQRFTTLGPVSFSEAKPHAARDST